MLKHSSAIPTPSAPTLPPPQSSPPPAPLIITITTHYLPITPFQAESGAYLPHQQIWDEKRLAIVRKALCTYGELAEDELPAAIDIVLT